jgi:hypothetical protein
MFVEHVSKSPIWKETAIFILEDDAQNGADHVDAHRSTAYIAGGFVKRNFVDHTMYSTSSMLRTMKLILGMPPMTQYDAAATPMFRCFTNTADASIFNAIKPNIDLNEKNIATNKWQEISENLNFAKEDAAPDNILNNILWVAMRGENAIAPTPKRAAFIRVIAKKDDDD